MTSGGRAQSETLGILLLLGITIVGTTAIVMYGATALNETEDSMRTNNVENSMKQLDARASRVAIGGSNAQSVTIPREGAATVRAEPDRGWVNVSVRNRTRGSTRTILNQSLGTVVYERGDKQVAYQGGGVWRKVGNDTVMLSSPEFHFQGQTLTLPVVVVDSEGELGETVRIERNGSAERVFPGTTNLTNPISGDQRVDVTIHSEYYRGWASFLRERAGGVVIVDHENETVTLQLVSSRPEPESVVEGGIFSTTTPSGKTVTLDNHAFIASYNSSKYVNAGDRSKTLNGSRTEGEIVIAGKLKVQSGNTEVRGEVHTGNKVQIPSSDSDGDLAVWGHVFCYDMPNSGCLPNSPNRLEQVDFEDGSDRGTAVDDGPVGNFTERSGDELPEPKTVQELLGFTVAEKIDGVRADNDNANVSAIDNSTDEFENRNVEVGPGTYYLSNLDEDAQTITLNLTKDGGGNITLAVDGNFDLDSDATVCVVYDEASENQVSVFLADGGKLILDNGADVITVEESNVDDAAFDCEDENDASSGDNEWDPATPGVAYNGTHMSNRLWLYAPPGLDAEFGQRTDFTGVIYAPGTNSQVASVTLGGGGRIYGAVVAFVDKIGKNNRESAIFYDQRLDEERITPAEGVRPVKVSYLHISVTRVNVSSSG